MTDRGRIGAGTGADEAARLTIARFAVNLKIRATKKKSKAELVNNLRGLFGPLPGRRIENAFPQTKGFWGRFDKLVGADVLDGPLETHL